MNWHEVLIQQTVNGVTRGAVFALIALGYTMVYGIIGLINFAHGDVFMLGLFISLSYLTLLGMATTLHGWQLVTVLPLVCSLASVVWQFGTLQLLGYGLDPLAVLVPFLVIPGARALRQIARNSNDVEVLCLNYFFDRVDLSRNRRLSARKLRCTWRRTS